MKILRFRLALVLCAGISFSLNVSLPALATHVNIRATSLPVQRKTTTFHGHVVTVIEHQWRLGEGDLGDCVMRDGAILSIDSETAEAQLSGVFYSRSAERRLLKFKIFGSVKAQPGVLAPRDVIVWSVPGVPSDYLNRWMIVLESPNHDYPETLTGAAVNPLRLSSGDPVRFLGSEDAISLQGTCAM